MPVRKIPKNHLFVTGRHATLGSAEMVEFEATLERDHMLLLDADSSVASYEAQPVRIPLPGKSYVPDLLVNFHPDADGVLRPSELVEVKPQAFLDRYAEDYAPKFAAAKISMRRNAAGSSAHGRRKTSERQGWRTSSFCVATDDMNLNPTLWRVFWPSYVIMALRGRRSD